MAQYVDVSGRERPATETGQVRDKVQRVTGQLSDQAERAAGQAKGRVTQELGKRSTQAGNQITATAGDIRTTADELRRIGKEQPAKLAEQAAQRLDQVGEYLKDSDGERILNDIENLARRQPWAVAAGGFIIGLVASRFLKASSSERYRSHSSAGYAGASHSPIRSELGASYGTTAATGFATESAGYTAEGYATAAPESDVAVEATDPLDLSSPAYDPTEPTRR